MTTPEALDLLAEHGQIIWQNERYGSRYVIDRGHLLEMISADAIPVIHAGQPEVISAVRSAFPQTTWIIAQLWCPPDIARSRIVERGTGDVDARLAAWEATPLLEDAHLNIDTSLSAPTESADAIRRAMESE
ncbi:kinase [Nocardia sp. R16R-3T]